MTFARHFSTSSRHLTKAWMAKHVSDPYVRRSVKENYRARSAFKLIEMNNTYKFIEPGHAVIDMGAAPGAWSQVLVKQVNARILSTRKQVNRSVRENNSSHPSEITSDYKPNLDLKCGTVIALDRSPIFAIPGVHIIDDWNLTDETTDDCYKRLKDLLARLKIDRVDGILSDMCPNVTGCKEIDHTGKFNIVLRKTFEIFAFSAIVNLQQSAFDFARRLLKSNGYFLCKLFHGHNSFQEMRSLLESLFRQVHLIKPSASRIESAEVYLLALQYHGDTSSQTSTKKQNELERMLEEARRVRTKKKS